MKAGGAKSPPRRKKTGRCLSMTSVVKTEDPSPFLPLSKPCHWPKHRPSLLVTKKTPTYLLFCRFWSQFSATFLATPGHSRTGQDHHHKALVSFFKPRPCPTPWKPKVVRIWPQSPGRRRKTNQSCRYRANFQLIGITFDHSEMSN